MRVCVSHQKPWRGQRRTAPASQWASSARSVVCLGTALLWICRRSSCVRPKRLFCTSSSPGISRALRMCALKYRTWTTLLSVIAATRCFGQATRVQPGARRAMYSVSEIPIKRFLASQMVLCQEHSLSASLCHVQHQRVIQSTVWTCIYSADERKCMFSCANGCSMVGDPAVWTCMTNDSWTDGGRATCEPQMCADMSLGRSVASNCDESLYSYTRTVSCASGYVASDMLFSSVSLLQVYQMGFFPVACC